MRIKWEFNKIRGIYKITNLVNNNCYIGSSKNIYDRLHRHKTELIRNKHFNQHLQNAVNKHGINNFSCEIIEQCKEDQTLICEQKWLDLLEPHYNIMKKANKVIIEESTKLKISNKLKSKYKSGELINSAEKKVYIYTVFGEFIGEFRSAKFAYKAIGCSENTMSNLLSKKSRNFKDYMAFDTYIKNPKTIGRKYKLTDTYTGEINFFHMQKDCVAFLGCSKRSFEYPLKNKTLFKKRYQIECCSV